MSSPPPSSSTKTSRSSNERFGTARGPSEPETSLPIAELIDRIGADLGADAVSTDPTRLSRASTDWAHMSPILRAKLPAGMADVVVTPQSADEIPVVLRHAYELGVPVTPRGTGLGN